MNDMAIGGWWRVGVVMGALGLFMLGASGSGQAAPGDLDPTFGSGGKVTTDFGGFAWARALALQPDGKIVVAGFFRGDFALARYTVTGSLDPTFGSGGKVLTDFGGLSGEVRALALQPDGKIVVAGYSLGLLGGSYQSDFAVARYTANGSLDPTFGSGGTVFTDFGRVSEEASALALQPDGKIVVAGLSSGDFALARYTANGSLDPTFGSAGKVVTDFGTNADEAMALAIQPDGKIVVAGVSGDSDLGSEGFAVARYTANGSLDPAFGSGGKVLTPLGGDSAGAGALALQPDGKIVVAGFSGGLLGSSVQSDFALTRYTANGSLDPSFGSGGKVLTDFGDTYEGASALAVQPDGKIVVAGWSWNGSALPGAWALARYTATGSLDPSFGSEGKVLTDFGGDGAFAYALALQPDGKIVIAGFSEDGDSKFAVARYRGDPTVFLGLTLNRATVAVSDVVQLNSREANSGPTITVDKYVGATLPAGSGPAAGCPANDPVAFVTESRALVFTCLSAPAPSVPPFARSVTIPADLPLTETNVLNFPWPAGAPPGTYVFFEAFVGAGSSDLLAAATAAVRSSP